MVSDEGIIPGIHTVSVKSLMSGADDGSSSGMTSNQGVFIVVPHIREVDIITIPGSVIVIGTGLSSGKSDSVALLGSHVIAENEWDETADDRIRFTIPADLHGEIPFRIRVNGFENIDHVVTDLP